MCIPWLRTEHLQAVFCGRLSWPLSISWPWPQVTFTILLLPDNKAEDVFLLKYLSNSFILLIGFSKPFCVLRFWFLQIIHSCVFSFSGYFHRMTVMGSRGRKNGWCERCFTSLWRSSGLHRNDSWMVMEPRTVLVSLHVFDGFYVAYFANVLLFSCTPINILGLLDKCRVEFGPFRVSKRHKQKC